MDLFRLNKIPYSWQSTTIRVDLAPITGALSLDFEDGRERPLVYAGRKDGRPIGKPAGKSVVPPATFKVLEVSGIVIMEYLTAKGLGSYGDADFTLNIQVSELPTLTGPPPTPILYILEDCSIIGVKNSKAEGGEASAIEFSIQPEAVSRNGMVLYSRVRGLPL